MDKIKDSPIVWQISALHLDNKILVTGVILNDISYTNSKNTGLIRNFLKTLKSYFVSVYHNKEISIITANDTVKTTTDDYGSFMVVLENNSGIEQIIVKTADSKKPLNIIQTYPVFFQNTTSPIDIISDIDDTIVVSYTKNVFKRIRAIAFTPLNKRKPIGFTQKLFKVFDKHDARVLYISKSESNLFAMLTAIIEHNKLPEGNLILTHYLKFRQLFKPKKGRDYKLNHIRFILKNTGSKKYVLLGDDSQKDMEVYSEIIREFPGRIVKVYIRQTRQKVRSSQKKMLNKLMSTEIPVDYFNDTMEGELDNEYKTLIDKIL